MKKIFTLIFLFSVVISYSQESDTISTKNTQLSASQVLYFHNSLVYQAANRYNDYSVAKQALYNLLAENPKNDSILYSLSLLYYQSQNYPSAALTARDILLLNPNNLGAMEIAAVSYDNIGAKDKALEQYESLYLLTDSYETLYRVANLQYELKNYNESKTNIDILLSKSETQELKIVLNNDAGQEEEFPIEIGLINLKGMIAQAEGNNELAKEFYNKALEIAPSFKLAKDNMESIQNPKN